MVAICRERDCKLLCHNVENDLKARKGKVAELEMDIAHKATIEWDAKGRDGEESDGK